MAGSTRHGTGQLVAAGNSRDRPERRPSMHKTKSIGMLGELAVAKQLISLGYEVFQEVGDDSKIDLLVHRMGRFIRVQVKTVSSSSNGIVSVPRWKTTNGRKTFYTIDDIDVMAMYVIDRDVILYTSIGELGDGLGVTIRFDDPKIDVKFLSASDFLSFERAACI